jgi:magnesium-transporting ATPase (P-type)
MIPEGLPAVMTITLAIGVSRMAKRHAIIRHLPAVETLGSTTVICSDKTGTLTCNEMTVQQLWAGNERFEVSGIGYAPHGSISYADQELNVKTRTALLELLQAGLLCNDSNLKQTEEGWVIEGDPTEGALLVSAHKAGLDTKSLINQKPRHDAIAFESQHQYMATLHSDKETKERIIYLKGSVESVLQRCNQLFGENDKLLPLNHAEIHRQVEIIAKHGLRVLAFARLNVPKNTQHINHETVASGLDFVGLQGMIDPPREEATQAIAACQTAGIEVKMITGDHPATASAIASQLGLINKAAIVLNGKDLESLFDAELIQAASTTSVFARVTP